MVIFVAAAGIEPATSGKGNRRAYLLLHAALFNTVYLRPELLTSFPSLPGIRFYLFHIIFFWKIIVPVKGHKVQQPLQSFSLRVVRVDRGKGEITL